MRRAKSKAQSEPGSIPEDLRAAFRNAVWSYGDWNPVLAEPEVPLRDRRYLDDYLSFWLTGGDGGGLERHYHQFSNWTASAVYDRWLADGEDPADAT